MSSIRRTAKLTTADREVTVLRRYTIKVDHNDLHAGDIVLVIRNDKGVEYTVTLRKGTKRHECTCPSWKPCYHIKAMVSIENARWQAEKAKVAEEAKRIQEDSDRELAEMALEAEVTVEMAVNATKIERYRRNYATNILAAKQNKEKILGQMAEVRERAALNGNRAFSILR